MEFTVNIDKMQPFVAYLYEGVLSKLIAAERGLWRFLFGRRRSILTYKNKEDFRMTPKQFRMLRLYRGETQKEFAKSIEVANSTVAKIEAGLVGITETTKSRIYRKFDLLDEEFMTFCQRMNGGK